MFRWLIRKSTEFKKATISRLEPGIYLVSGTDMAQAWLVYGLFVVISSELIAIVTPLEVKAIIEHERGHRAHFDWLKRVIHCRVYRWCDWTDMCHKQEFAADAYAAKRGHAKGLVRYLSRNLGWPASPVHPSNNERVNKLSVFLEETK